jgi:hypothetical protein
VIFGAIAGAGKMSPGSDTANLTEHAACARSVPSMALRSWLVCIALFGIRGAAEAAPAETLPVAHVSTDGPALTFDFPAVRIGVAEYEEGPTGATAVVDVRGGAPGTLNTDLLRLGLDAPVVNAITLAGGSAYGLSVATGVANALKSEPRIRAIGKTSRWCLRRSSSILAGGATTR